MYIPDVVGLIEEDAKKILEDRGLKTTSKMYDVNKKMIYGKPGKLRVIRQNNFDNTIQLTIATECEK